MRLQVGGKSLGRALLAAALALTTTGAVVLVSAPTSALPAAAQPSVMHAAGQPAAMPAADPAAPVFPAPADVVRETGSWYSHGYTLDLRPDGTGTFAVWMGAFDGDRLQLRLIPAPGDATVAEVVAVETVGGGALGRDARPGIGGLVTILFGEGVRTAHVEWTSGPHRHLADLCPAAGLDAAEMELLRCGA